MKTDSMITQKSLTQSIPTVGTEIINVHRLLLTQKSLTRTESQLTQKLSTQSGFTASAEIISAHGLLLTQKSLMRIESLSTQKSSMNLVLWLTQKSSTHMPYY